MGNLTRGSSPGRTWTSAPAGLKDSSAHGGSAVASGPDPRRARQARWHPPAGGVASPRIGLTLAGGTPPAGEGARFSEGEILVLDGKGRSPGPPPSTFTNHCGATMRPIIVGVLVLWLVVVFLLGAIGAFSRPPGTPPFPILIGATAPLVVFLAAYWGSAAFHAFVLSIDLPLATAIQAWRAGGLGFLALYAAWGAAGCLRLASRPR